jgi:hypothetical protein
MNLEILPDCLNMKLWFNSYTENLIISDVKIGVNWKTPYFTSVKYELKFVVDSK